MTEGGRFPIWSTLALLYPIGAAVYLYQQSGNLLVAIGYGLANLGYLLVAAAIVTGTFLVLGLRRRRDIFITAVLAWVLGTVLANLVVRSFSP